MSSYAYVHVLNSTQLICFFCTSSVCELMHKRWCGVDWAWADMGQGLGAEVQGQSPWTGGQGKTFLKLKTFYGFGAQRKHHAHLLHCDYTWPTPPPPSGKKLSGFASIPGMDHWQKWGGHFHPSPPRGDAPNNQELTVTYVSRDVCRETVWRLWKHHVCCQW